MSLDKTGAYAGNNKRLSGLLMRKVSTSPGCKQLTLFLLLGYREFIPGYRNNPFSFTGYRASAFRLQ